MASGSRGSSCGEPAICCGYHTGSDSTAVIGRMSSSQPGSIWMPCRFGGARPYFICPGVVNGMACGRRVVKLYGAARYFLCRHCYRLAYASQREDRYDRALRRANNMRARLGGDPSTASLLPRRPKGMHERTYQRLLSQILDAEMTAEERLTIFMSDSEDRTPGQWPRLSPASQGVLEMSLVEKVETLLQQPASSYEDTRFNALRHGVLSQYTVLPWENSVEYHALIEALVVEHKPQGPTEEHLVEELAGIVWRKRRLRLAEGAAHHRALMRAAPMETPPKRPSFTSPRMMGKRTWVRRSGRPNRRRRKNSRISKPTAR